MTGDQIDISTLGAEAQAVHEECLQKLRRRSAEPVQVFVEEDEPLGIVPQFSAWGVAVISNPNTTNLPTAIYAPGSLRVLASVPESERPHYKHVLRVTESTPLAALQALRDNLG